MLIVINSFSRGASSYSERSCYSKHPSLYWQYGIFFIWSDGTLLLHERYTTTCILPWKDALTYHTGQMSMLIWVFAGCKDHILLMLLCCVSNHSARKLFPMFFQEKKTYFFSLSSFFSVSFLISPSSSLYQLLFVLMSQIHNFRGQWYINHERMQL